MSEHPLRTHGFVSQPIDWKGPPKKSPKPGTANLSFIGLIWAVIIWFLVSLQPSLLAIDKKGRFLSFENFCQATIHSVVHKSSNLGAMNT